MRALTTRNGTAEIEEVLPPRSRRQPVKKLLINRCCWVTPDRESFGQLTGLSSSPSREETETEDALPDINTLSELHKEMRKAYCNPTVEIASQCRSFDIISDARWRHVDDVDEIARMLVRPRDEGTLTHYHSLPKNFHICEVPRVKIIAVKFAKYKKCNIEVRKIEEKVVCVEYDVLEGKEPAKPVQIMRAFFSIKPAHGDNKENVPTDLPSTIKAKYNISAADLQKLSKNEVEIVDGKILENRPYLDDLRKILRRRQTSAKAPKHTLNLKTLYEMAKRELLELDTSLDRNVLTKEELLEIQNLILINCKSSAHGISRRTVNKRQTDTSDVCADGISRSLVAELLRVESGVK